MAENSVDTYLTKEGYPAFRIHVTPGASKNKLTGTHNGALKISVTAKPEKGKANKAVIEFVAKILKTNKSSLKIISGEKSREKKIVVTDIDLKKLKSMLEEALKK